MSYCGCKEITAENFEVRFNSMLQVSYQPFNRLKCEAKNTLNPYSDGFSFDLYANVSENETSFRSESELVWLLKNQTYGPYRSLRDLQ